MDAYISYSSDLSGSQTERNETISELKVSVKETIELSSFEKKDNSYWRSNYEK
jgi:hypothetical protein